MAANQSNGVALVARSIKVSDAEWAAWKRAAERDGRSLSSWLKHLANSAAKRAAKKG